MIIRLRAEQSRCRGSVPGNEQFYFLFETYKQIWGPPNRLCNDWRSIFLRAKSGPTVKLTKNLKSARNWFIPPPHMASSLAQRQIFFNKLSYEAFPACVKGTGGSLSGRILPRRETVPILRRTSSMPLYYPPLSPYMPSRLPHRQTFFKFFYI